MERIRRRGLLVVMLLRLNPLTSSDLVSYAAGLVGVPVWRVALGTLVGMAPLCYAQAHASEWLFRLLPGAGIVADRPGHRLRGGRCLVVARGRAEVSRVHVISNRHRLHPHQSRSLRLRAEATTSPFRRSARCRRTPRDVRRCAEWTADEMRRIGLENVRLVETPGNPVVYGDWLARRGRARRSCSTATTTCSRWIRVELWESPPFEATVRDGEIYARGAADDKGQVFMHLKAIEAHLKKNGPLPVNIKLVIEGEEEVGSANLDEFVRANKAAARGRRRRDFRLGDVRPRRAVDLLLAARPRRTSRSTCAARRATCTPACSAAPWPIPRWCSRRCWRR